MPNFTFALRGKELPHHMHFEERNWYISLLLNGELDSAR